MNKGPVASHPGLRIAALREHARLSQRALAELAGVSHSYVTKLESGEIRSPSAARLERIAAALRWPDHSAMLASDELDPPREPSWTPQKLDDLREWQAAQSELLAEFYSVLLGLRRDVRTLIERTQAPRTPPPESAS